MQNQDTSEDTLSTQERIIAVATELVASGGISALTTRAVASAASVQAPTIYRLFGDKRGLLDAVAEFGLTQFIAQKLAAEPNPDPVQDLRDAWDAYVAFGVSNPAVFAIMNDIGSTHSQSMSAKTGIGVLKTRIQRIAHAGLLLKPVESAVALVHAAGVGTVTTLLSTPECERRTTLSDDAREAVFSSLIAGTKPQRNDNLATLANGLREQLEQVDTLSPGELLLLGELLEKIAR
ncbi:TetR/AcrR family transcriptional regulator [Hahella aquimaris]|uniref:TetR/AcrR family transcriptional regulator n=1 Tax=Hahella sp. HNIBRBA332 TaxID=3015983 RepID=UPI00273C1910|nr:TetR/AcrR family transcriptional regulator [Hahella sp. HNIBRBA332]WLQ16295.1 TetR/AcrR family transcriptional regulator [Hahella sp. HNIBRBA332]